MKTVPTTEWLERPGADPKIWPLDPDVIFLNHGSFGSCPREVLEFQQGYRNRLERQPVQFLVRDLEPLLDNARIALAGFVGADPDDLVFVPNATAGVNTVLRSLPFEPGDELLVTNHEYNACRNALVYAAERTGAKVLTGAVPFPLNHPDQVVEAVVGRVTSRTRLALIDHVTSQTGLIFPIADLIRELKSRGVETLVDGAHAPGMVPLNLRALGATYYTGNCHKWLCAPKTAGFLHVQKERQPAIRPLVISHGATSKRTDRSRFQVEFGWIGTWDPSACLSVPEALRVIGSLRPGGWTEVMERNHALALAARERLCEALKIASPCPDLMIGSLAAVPLPDSKEKAEPVSPLYADPLQDVLRNDFGIEVPVIPWPSSPKRLLRVSAQLYNALPQYERLAEALVRLFPS
jgi:isopenicillin-N epimerase